MTRRLTLAAAILALALAHPLSSLAAGIERVGGTVKALTATSVTLVEEAGKVRTVPLSGDWSVIVSKPISVEDIAAGSYIGTTNYATPEGTGRSLEVHVSPPGVTGPGVDFVMDAAAGTTMTNGVVATVVNSEGGRVLSVDHGHGVRRVTVPPGVPVVLNRKGERSLVRVGRVIRVTTFTPADGGPPRQFIAVGENGAPPPPQ